MSERLIGDRCPKCKGSTTIPGSVGGVSVEVGCDACAGTGVVNSPNACKKCRGSGSIIAHFAGGLNVEAICDHCMGSGLKPKPG